MAAHPIASDLPRISVLTITYNQRDAVLALLSDLAQQDYPSHLFEVVVLDDGGTDGTFAAVCAEKVNLPYAVVPIRQTHEQDYLSGRLYNRCIDAADSSSQVFVQAEDVRVRPDFLTQHVKWHRDSQLRVVTGAKFEAHDETWDLSTCRRAHLAGPDGQARTITQWTAGWAASMSYTRDLASRASTDPKDRPYDERMTGWGLQEVELAYRMIQAGSDLVYDPAAGVFHRLHNQRSEQEERGIDRKGALETGYTNNKKYVLAKHGLAELPRW